MSKQTIQLVGDVNLQRILKQLPEKANARVIKSAARAGSRPIIESARSKVPVKSGDLKRSIKFITSKSKKWPGGFVVVDVKKDRGFNFMKGKVHAFGAKNDRRHKSGKSVGNIKKPIRDFIKEAAEDSGIEAVAIVQENLVKFLDREIQKLAK